MASTDLNEKLTDTNTHVQKLVYRNNDMNCT